MTRYLYCIVGGAVAGVALLVVADFVMSQCFDASLVPF